MAADPFEGTWKLNVGKSKLDPAREIATETMKIVKTGPDSFKTITDITTKSGQNRHQETDRILDGKEHSTVEQGASEIVERPSESTRKITGKRDGKKIGEILSTISPDGKIMINQRKTSTGEETLVFEKQ